MKKRSTTNNLKFQKIIYFIIYVILILGLLYSSLYLKNFHYSSVILFTFIISLLPAYIEKKTNLYIPPFFKSSYIIFIFSSIFLGEMLHFYKTFFWWDTVLHFLSGIGLGVIGFTLIHALTIDDQNIKSRKFLNFIFSLSFAVFLGVFWEFIEFSMDALFGLTMQDSNTDTMKDLFVDTLGALIGAYSGIFFLENKLNYLLSFVIKEFFKKNFHHEIKK